MKMQDILLFVIVIVASIILISSVIDLFDDYNPNDNSKANNVYNNPGNYGNYNGPNSDNLDNPDSSAAAPIALGTQSTGSTDTGDVSIAITPSGIKEGAIVFTVAANTHSVELTQFDLTKIAALEYGKKRVTPLSASVLSGHHSSGSIVFPFDGNINDINKKKLRLTIKGIPSIQERIFEWG